MELANISCYKPFAASWWNIHSVTSLKTLQLFAQEQFLAQTSFVRVLSALNTRRGLSWTGRSCIWDQKSPWRHIRGTLQSEIERKSLLLAATMSLHLVRLCLLWRQRLLIRDIFFFWDRGEEDSPPSWLTLRILRPWKETYREDSKSKNVSFEVCNMYCLHHMT